MPSSVVSSVDPPTSAWLPHRGGRLHLITADPRAGQEVLRDVLLLHGRAFRAQTWLELETLAALARHGHRAVALDLPGFGASEPVEHDPDLLLAELVPSLELRRPVVVAPSMSGRYAFPLVVGHPELVGGFVPVAPVGAAEHGPRLVSSAVPTLVVWGERDELFPVDGAAALARQIPGARTLILPGARHPCYLDRPAAFHEGLLGFIEALGAG
jgi:abhydrolase domain-containing protein 14